MIQRGARDNIIYMRIAASVCLAADIRKTTTIIHTCFCKVMEYI